MSHITCHECGGNDHIAGYGFGASLYGGYTICECNAVLELRPDTEGMPEAHVHKVTAALAEFVTKTNEKRRAKNLPLLDVDGGQPELHGFDGDECRSNSCIGCGERVRYLEMVRRYEDGLLHEGCDHP